MRTKRYRQMIDILIETITSLIIASRQILCRAQKYEMKTKQKRINIK